MAEPQKMKCGSCGGIFLPKNVDRHLASASHKAAQARTVKRHVAASAKNQKAVHERTHQTEARRRAWTPPAGASVKAHNKAMAKKHPGSGAPFHR
jgi:hypothetical protein